MSKDGDLKQAASSLYKIMRKLKNKKYKSIAVSEIPNYGIGRAINDRLRKAANK